MAQLSVGSLKIDDLTASRVVGLNSSKVTADTAMTVAELNTHVGQRLFGAKKTGVSFTTGTNTDITTVSLPSGITTWVPFKVIVSNPSATLAIATFDLRTASGGGGTAIVSAGVLTNLTASTKFADITLQALTDVLTATTLTIRQVAGALGTATCDITLWGFDLT